MLFCRTQNLIDWLLDSDVYRLKTVITQNDIDQVLADIVNVTAHGCQQNAALASVFSLFDEWLKVGNCGLHDLS